MQCTQCVAVRQSRDVKSYRVLCTTSAKRNADSGEIQYNEKYKVQCPECARNSRDVKSYRVHHECKVQCTSGEIQY